MEELGWDRGQDDEELFEFAMHDKQYRDFKSGEAKKRFNIELREAMEQQLQSSGKDIKIPDLRALRHPNAEPVTAPVSGRIMWEFDFVDVSVKPAIGTVYAKGDLLCAIQTNGRGLEVVPALFPGQIVEVLADQGALVKKGDIIAYIEQ